MTAAMTIVRRAAGSEVARWDALVREFPNHRVAHTRAWVESLAACGCGEPLFLVFEREGRIAGCLPGLVSSIGPWRLFGSPRAGWQTVSMGPAFDPEVLSTPDIMDSLVPYLEQEHGVAHIEVMNTGLDADVMRARGFHGEPVITYRAQLYPGDEKKTFKAMKDSARRNVQRAQRLGLEVRFEEGESFVDEHYDQLREVYLRRGHAIPFSKQRILECFRHMRGEGRLLAPAVYLPGGRICIATGTFFIEGKELYLWMWAHRTHYRWYRPTEFMTWAVIQRALKAGCESFDLMGGGDFKSKFGAERDLTKWRWIRSRPRWLMKVRELAETGFHWQQAARGHARRVVSQAAARVRGTTAEHRPPACVIGDIDLVQALGLAGISSVVLAPPGSPSRFSRFTRGTLDWIDPSRRPDDLVDALVAHGLAQPEPPPLFYQDDQSLLLVSRHRDRLRQAFRFVLADAALVEMLVDKTQFQTQAERFGLRIPPARTLLPGAEPAPGDLGLPYPVVIKPQTRRTDMWDPIAHGGKAILVRTAEELGALWPRLSAVPVPVLAQSFIPGPESCIESYHVYADERGTIVAEFTGRKVRTDPAEFGDTSALEITDAPDVVAAGQYAVRRLKLCGVAKLDFKRAPDGTLYLLEVNPRFTLWHHAGAVAGVNIPALVYGDLLSRPRAPVPVARAGVRWTKPWRDRAAARTNGIGMLPWLAWTLQCESKSGIVWHDPLPLAAAGVWRILARRHRGAVRDGAPFPARTGPALATRSRS